MSASVEIIRTPEQIAQEQFINEQRAATAAEFELFKTRASDPTWPARKAKNEADAAEARQYAKLRNLIELSPAQVQAWVSANVTNLAQAQDAIATLAVAVSVLGRRL
jgi:hypothetical protein